MVAQGHHRDAVHSPRGSSEACSGRAFQHTRRCIRTSFYTLSPTADAVSGGDPPACRPVARKSCLVSCLALSHHIGLDHDAVTHQRVRLKYAPDTTRSRSHQIPRNPMNRLPSPSCTARRSLIRLVSDVMIAQTPRSCRMTRRDSLRSPDNFAPGRALHRRIQGRHDILYWFWSILRLYPRCRRRKPQLVRVRRQLSDGRLALRSEQVLDCFDPENETKHYYILKCPHQSEEWSEKCNKGDRNALTLR